MRCREQSSRKEESNNLKFSLNDKSVSALRSWERDDKEVEKTWQDSWNNSPNVRKAPCKGEEKNKVVAHKCNNYREKCKSCGVKIDKYRRNTPNNEECVYGEEGKKNFWKEDEAEAGERDVRLSGDVSFIWADWIETLLSALVPRK